jgi:hypothetical protein
MFEKHTQLSILLENAPGRFAEVCDLLYKNGVDILAMAATPIGESGIVRMVVDKPDQAIDSLRAAQLQCLQTDVLVARVPNEPGMAAGLGYRFMEARVNIEYTYFTGGPVGTEALLVFKVADANGALKRLALLSDKYN